MRTEFIAQKKTEKTYFRVSTAKKFELLNETLKLERTIFLNTFLLVRTQSFDGWRKFAMYFLKIVSLFTTNFGLTLDQIFDFSMCSSNLKQVEICYGSNTFN